MSENDVMNIFFIIFIIGIVVVPVVYYIYLCVKGDDKSSNGGSDHDSGLKEKPPTYKLLSVEFNKISRNAKIHFLQTTEYRTVERYVQQNYVRYPVLSNWKIKTKEIDRSVKLTNIELEGLCDHDDPLIEQFAFDIVNNIQDDIQLPSWYLRKVAQTEFDKQNEILESKRSTEQWKAHREISHCEYVIKMSTESLDSIMPGYEKQSKRENKASEKLKKKPNSKRLIKKHTKESEKLKLIQKEIDSQKDKISKKQKAIKGLEENLAVKISEIEEECKKVQESFDQKLSEIRYLRSDPVVNKIKVRFDPLKVLSGYGHSKIIGCYIIRNTKNGKCYVGQSKDIIRRLRQHFNGTEPKNMLFAEDYFACDPAEREDLFEFRIVRCETKDELDKTERSLIKEYDSRVSGYNQTAGNQ